MKKYNKVLLNYLQFQTLLYKFKARNWARIFQ